MLLSIIFLTREGGNLNGVWRWLRNRREFCFSYIPDPDLAGGRFWFLQRRVLKAAGIKKTRISYRQANW
jgi:hypothetical protein